MGLAEYKKKRKFNNTPEPEGGKSASGELSFVVQKHAASRLHYDFRLELRGVMKSWAVPTGPSLLPADKRLAMQVEDHPMDYNNFEGIIPEGNYGAGTVIIWDQGTYEPVGDFKTKKDREKQVTAGLKKGSLKIRLFGTKLQGEFALVQTKSRGDNSWLLIKHRDEFVSDRDILLDEKSVVSGRTIEETESDSGSRRWKSNKSQSKGLKRKTSARSETVSSYKTSLSKVTKKKKAGMPDDIQPMLATLVDSPFDESGWLYEVKWDGFRAMAYVDKKEVRLRSRNNKAFDKKFYPIHKALSDWGARAVVDGEIIVVNEKGEPDFSAL